MSPSLSAEYSANADRFHGEPPRRLSASFWAFLLTVVIQVCSIVWAAARRQAAVEQQRDNQVRSEYTQGQLVQSLNTLNGLVYDLRERVRVIEDREILLEDDARPGLFRGRDPLRRAWRLSSLGRQ